MTDRDDYEEIDVQADRERYREEVINCLTTHLDEGHVRSVVSFGQDPRSILATCDKCERFWWFEEVAAAEIPGTPEYEEVNGS